MIDQSPIIFIAATEASRELSLLLGVATFIGGLLAMFSHQRAFKSTFQQPLKRSEVIFENRKYRRRVVVAALISSLGLMIASLKWITEPRPFASLILIILITLLAIFAMALIDMYSVGLQAYTRKKDPTRDKLIQEYMQRKSSEASVNETDKSDG